MRFDNLIIYSDVDGTATYSIGRKAYVSKENKDAINDFVKNGGLFGVASGRSHDSILDVIKDNEYLYHLKSARSADIYLEMFDLFAGKDLGIKRVIEEYSLDNKTLVCIGDHYNDIEMLKMADIAICPKNAVDEVKNICEYVADDCHNNAIKGAIEYLRSR